MFGQSKNFEEMTEKELMLHLISEVDEVKRYAANVHMNTDTEVAETKDLLKRVDRQLTETDRQVDKIEQFEREITDIRNLLRNIERKLH